MVSRCRDEFLANLANVSGRSVAPAALIGLFRNPEDLIQSCHAAEDLIEAVVEHDPHSTGNGRPANILRGCPLKGKFPDFVVQYHQFKDAHAAFVAPLLALHAASALHEVGSGKLFWREASCV